LGGKYRGNRMLTFSYQLNEQIQKDMQMEKVDHFCSLMLDPLFFLKADS
jgi:hypothetical protein